MCVIIIKEKGVALPSNNILERAAMYNPHGFGFCTPRKMYKTLSFEAFMENIHWASKNEPCIIHFRYATTGSVKRANCHPFKHNDIYFAHNGVLNIDTKNDMTDSETFFKGCVMPVINRFGFDSAMLKNVLGENAGWSKFALMKGSEIRTFGNFERIGDCYYSNSRFINSYYSIN